MYRPLHPDDQKIVGRWLARVVAFYLLLGLIVVAIVAVRVNFIDPQIAAMKRGKSTYVPQASRLDRLASAFSAMAAESPGMAECALPDRRLVAAIESRREAQDVLEDRLGEIFSAAMKARAACEAGNFGEALAIYESIVVAPSNP